MERVRVLISLAAFVTFVNAYPLQAIPNIHETTSPDFILSGENILTLDYLEIRNNHVQKDAPTYPFGKIWLILYKPHHYEKKEHMSENDWLRSQELARYPIPGPSKDSSWMDKDQTVFKNTGIYKWSDNDLQSIVFRLMVEQTSLKWDSETLTWGIIREMDSFNSLTFETKDVMIIFRTCNLPERRLPPKAVINNIWFIHNATKGSLTGIQINVDFNIENMRAHKCRIAAFIHSGVTNKAVMCELDDPYYKTPGGAITSQQDFIPLYTNTSFPNFKLFIPYDTFPVSANYSDYYALIQILDEKWSRIESKRSEIFQIIRQE